jgi:hypothetical protein
VRVGDGVRVEGGDVIALAPEILHHLLRAGGTLHHQWRVYSVWSSQPGSPMG